MQKNASNGENTHLLTHNIFLVVDSSPASATNIANRKRYRFGKPRNHNGFWVFSCHFSRCNSKDIISPKRPLGRTWTKYLGFFGGGVCDFFSQSLSFFVSLIVKCLCLGRLRIYFMRNLLFCLYSLLYDNFCATLKKVWYSVNKQLVS